ncbi:MAG: hypothetical protein IT347_03435 [Candidatus Eisenbacteria bacterium]|nr:hypothetical protein [Candidatus Eisenbacteria bacterium]
MRRSVVILSCLLLVASASCGKSSRPVAAVPGAPPPADSPANAVRLLEWSWQRRDCDALPPLFTDDYRFVFAAGDSAGGAYSVTPWVRADELAASCGAFGQAVDIDVNLGPPLAELPDDRPGRNPVWHRSIRAPVSLKVTVDRGGGPELVEVHGYARFYFVRGDSAAIPAELAARGVRPDSTRWWMDRWEDETLPEGVRANPTQTRTWGSIKAQFRPPAV